MFCTIFPPAIGGPATQSFNLCQALKERGIKPVVVTYGVRFTKTEPNGYPVYTFRTGYGFGPLNKILRWFIFPPYLIFILLKEKIDILHCHSASALSFLSALIAKVVGIPRVLKFAGDWVWETLSTYELQGKDFFEVYQKSFLSRFMTRVEKIGLGLFNVIWTPSKFRQENIRYLLGDQAKTIIIPNCLLLKDGGYANKPTDEVVIVSANRFIPHKRISWLVEAYASVQTSKTKLILTGGGDPQEVQKVKDKIKELGLENSVRMTGIIPAAEVYQIFAGASFYASSSLEEGFPNVFIEAMHYGLPIVSTDVGGCREMVMEGETGFLTEPQDQKMLAEKMRILISNVGLREKMAKNAHERSKLFNLNERVGEFIAMYKNLLQK